MIALVHPKINCKYFSSILTKYINRSRTFTHRKDSKTLRRHALSASLDGVFLSLVRVVLCRAIGTWCSTYNGFCRTTEKMPRLVLAAFVDNTNAHLSVWVICVRIFTCCHYWYFMNAPIISSIRETSCMRSMKSAKWNHASHAFSSRFVFVPWFM